MSEPAAPAPSFWLDDLDEGLAPRPVLDRDLDVDVAIVGAGYTGLWTAYYLAALDPAWRIGVLEREQGFGDADFRWLDADACEARVRMAGAIGGLYSPHCAAVQPAALGEFFPSLRDVRITHRWGGA